MPGVAPPPPETGVTKAAPSARPRVAAPSGHEAKVTRDGTRGKQTGVYLLEPLIQGAWVRGSGPASPRRRRSSSTRPRDAHWGTLSPRHRQPSQGRTSRNPRAPPSNPPRMHKTRPGRPCQLEVVVTSPPDPYTSCPSAPTPEPASQGQDCTLTSKREPLEAGTHASRYCTSS